MTSKELFLTAVLQLPLFSSSNSHYPPRLTNSRPLMTSSLSLMTSYFAVALDVKVDLVGQ